MEKDFYDKATKIGIFIYIIMITTIIFLILSALIKYTKLTNEWEEKAKKYDEISNNIEIKKED